MCGLFPDWDSENRSGINLWRGWGKERGDGGEGRAEQSVRRYDRPSRVKGTEILNDISSRHKWWDTGSQPDECLASEQC